MSFKNNINGCTKVLCIIGHPVEHSMSPVMHNAVLQDLGLNLVYIAFDVKPNQLKEAVEGLKALEIIGFNVTIPYKENIIKYLDKIDSLAKRIGAINTVKNENGYLIGKNTDALGVKKVLLDAGFKIQGKNIIILGAGGAAKAISYISAEEANKIVIANRTEKRAIELVKNIKQNLDTNAEAKRFSENIIREELKNADILINATPIGMYPNVNQSPIPKEVLHPELFVFDVIYNPLETQLLKNAKDIGCKTLSGLEMLVNQGILAFEWWTNKKPNANLMKRKVIEYLEMK
ncbi:MAG: shikimate dehydrogenase [Candidatus Thorarchaeota archaeon]